MRNAMSPVDDSLFGGEPGQYKWISTAAGALGGVCAKAAHGLFKSGQRYQKLMDKLDSVSERIDTLTGRVGVVETVQTKRAETYAEVAENVAEMRGMVTALCRQNNTPVPSMRTPSPDVYGKHWSDR